MKNLEYKKDCLYIDESQTSIMETWKEPKVTFVKEEVKTPQNVNKEVDTPVFVQPVSVTPVVNTVFVAKPVPVSVLPRSGGRTDPTLVLSAFVILLFVSIMMLIKKPK
jgi:hypothetical protein